MILDILRAKQTPVAQMLVSIYPSVVDLKWVSHLEIIRTGCAKRMVIWEHFESIPGE